MKHGPAYFATLPARSQIKGTDQKPSQLIRSELKVKQLLLSQTVKMNSCYSYMLLICSVILLLPNCLGQKDQDNTSTIGASNTTLQAYPINTTTQLEVLDDKIFGGLGNRGKRAQRKTDSKKSKSKSAGKTRTSAPDDEHPENEKKENNHKTKGDDDNYHVRYETKFGEIIYLPIFYYY